MTEAKKQMTPKRIVDWVHALESGDYKQTTGVMYRQYDDAYCCLGVLSKINGEKEADLQRRIFPYEFDFGECLNEDESAFSGFAVLNDRHKLSFDQIAQVIRDACPELFEDEDEDEDED